MQAFKTMNKGFSKLADESEDFDSKTILGLLRDAPDLLPNIKNVQSMYEPIATEEKGMRFAPSCSFAHHCTLQRWMSWYPKKGRMKDTM